MSYELRDCIKSNNGKLYCYDCEIKQIVELNTTPKKLKELPDDVLDTTLLAKYETQGKVSNA